MELEPFVNPFAMRKKLRFRAAHSDFETVGSKDIDGVVEACHDGKNRAVSGAGAVARGRPVHCQPSLEIYLCGFLEWWIGV